MHFTRFKNLGIWAVLLIAPWMKGAAAKDVEYQRADTNFYLPSSVLKAEPGAVFVNAGSYRQEGDSYFLKPSHSPARVVYVRVVRDWLEPITPPSLPSSLGIDPNVMQIREPQGDVQVALPDQPGNFVPATEGMPIPNGTTVKTGGNGTAAVLFGGVNSARFSPNSEGTVQQAIDAQVRSTTVDLQAGAVFSKVGLRAGELQDYQVHTPFGVAAAKGTDFVAVAMPARTDVWIAQGTVQLNQPNGTLVGTVKSNGKGNLQIIRYPVIDDAHAAMMATAETMTAAMDFIPMVNLKLKALHDEMTQGIKLSEPEQKYLSLIKHVPALIKLTLVEPPAPAPKPAPVLKPPVKLIAPVMDTSPLEPTLAPPQRAPSMKKTSPPVAPTPDTVP